MEKLTKTQISLVASYSSPFVLLFALTLNIFLARLGVNSGFTKILVLSMCFPLGFFVGRLLYFRRSHVEIVYDESTFHVFKGRKVTLSGNWRDFKLVSIVVDGLGRPDIRLYKSPDGEFIELPVSATSAHPQDFRNYVLAILLRRRPNKIPSSLPAAEVS